MRKGERRFIVLWLVYFDKNKSRSEGRRVPKSLAVEKLALKDLENAVKSLNYEYVIEEDKKHPASWFDYQGRILVYTEERKKEVLRKVAEKLASTKKK